MLCADQAVSVTPLECPVGCALFFPSLMTDCEDTLAASGLSEDDMTDYQRFSERCLDQDSRALVYVRSHLPGYRKVRALNYMLLPLAVNTQRTWCGKAAISTWILRLDAVRKMKQRRRRQAWRRCCRPTRTAAGTHSMVRTAAAALASRVQVQSIRSSEAAGNSAIHACCRRSCHRDECGMLRWKC